jgi:hypothetical protein
MPNEIVRHNLLTQPGYRPYCGAEKCSHRWPRVNFNGKQFQCPCGWQSEFPADFIVEYKGKIDG